MKALVGLYTDLVELGLRTVSQEKSESEGIVLVPSLFREEVIAELERRGTSEGYLV